MLKKYMQPKFLLIICAPLLIFSTNQCYAKVAVGDSYGGGTVFCVSQTADTSRCVTEGSGDYGLIMANVDQANYDYNSDHGVIWSSENKVTGAQSKDDGAANTATIIAAHPDDNGTNNAAWLCHNYNAAGDIGSGFSGWYLPARNELNKMYLYAKANNLIGRNCIGKKDNGVQCLGGHYWDSTESSYSNARVQRFAEYGGEKDGIKIRSRSGVRAVRAFKNSTIQQFNQLAVRVMTGEAIYDRITEMPRELIGIITGYATADISRERMEKDRSEIAKCILEAAKGWPKVEREEAERMVKEMEVIAIAKELQAREEERVKAQQEELKKQEEAKRARQKQEESMAKRQELERQETEARQREQQQLAEAKLRAKEANKKGSCCLIM